MLLLKTIAVALALVGHPQPHTPTACTAQLVRPERATVGTRISIRVPRRADRRRVAILLRANGHVTQIGPARPSRGAVTVVLTASRLAPLHLKKAGSSQIEVRSRAGQRTAPVGCITVSDLNRPRKGGGIVAKKPAPPRTAPIPTSAPTSPTSSTSPTTSPTTTTTATTSPASPTLTSLSPPSAQPPARLRWSPPQLTNPQTVLLKSGMDPDYIGLDTTRDYILVIPPGGIHGTVEIDGGHNVVLIGGSITVPSSANQTDNGTDDTDTVLYIRASTGTVHIEGLQINGDPATQYDGIDINAPLAVVQLENIRVSNVWGSDTTEHADVVQTWGGVKDLRVDHLSADGDYQGLTIDPALGPVQSAEIQNVDLTLDPRPAALAATTVGGGYMIWLTNGVDTCDGPGSVTFANVYVANQSQRLPTSDTVWPPTTQAGNLPCAGVMTGNKYSWPSLSVTGSVTLSTPPDGAFVPSGTAGGGYKSPGYQ
jgi:hypothetical protein